MKAESYQKLYNHALLVPEDLQPTIRVITSYCFVIDLSQNSFMKG